MPSPTSILGTVSSGIDANIKLIDMSVPASLGLDLRVDPKTGFLVEMEQRASVAVDATLLVGEIVGWIKVDLHWWSEVILAAFGIDNGFHQHELVKWPGEREKFALINATHPATSRARDPRAHPCAAHVPRPCAPERIWTERSGTPRNAPSP